MMDIERLARAVDPEAARAFVGAARNVIDALLIEAERVERATTPTTRDYNTADLSRDTPAGGWIAPTELRATSRRLAEAIAADKWAEGVVFVLRLFRG